MDPEAALTSTENTHSTDFVTHPLLAIPVPFQGEKPGVRTGVNQISSVHYTEEHITIPETPVSQAVITNNNMDMNAFIYTNPGQAGTGSRVFVS
jgi:hypothetical protein